MSRSQFLTHEDFLTENFSFTTVVAAEAVANKGSRRLDMVTTFVKSEKGLEANVAYHIRTGGHIKMITWNLEHAIREYNTTMAT